MSNAAELLEMAKEVEADLLKSGDPLNGTDWSVMQLARFAIATLTTTSEAAGLPVTEGEPDCDYDRIVELIKQSPQTFMPALLVTTVEACIDKNVFRDHKAIERFVVQAILRKVNPNGER